jgi:hypothetical protein
MVQDYLGGSPSPIPAGVALVNLPGVTNPLPWNGGWQNSLYWKFYNNADSSYDFGEGTYHAAMALWYRGCDPTTPFLAGSTSFSVAPAATYTVPAIGGAPVANELYVGFAGLSGNALLTSDLLAIRENDSYPNNYNNASSGDTNVDTRNTTPTWFGANSNWATFGLILAPAAAGVSGSIRLPVATAADQLTMRVENALEPFMALCQTLAGPDDLPGKNAIMKVNLQLLSSALAAWVAALNAEIAAL